MASKENLALAVAASLVSVPVSAMAQATPPPFVHYEPPSASQVSASYRCPGTTVSLRIEHGSGRVRVAAYTGSAGRASRANLALWNEWLSGMENLMDYSVECQAGGYETISIRGKMTVGGRIGRVGVWWHAGRFGRMP